MVRMRKDVCSMLIDCPVTCCDVLNQDKSRPSVGSTQLLRLISILFKSQELWLGHSREISSHIYYWTDSSTCNRYTASTLNIVREAFGNCSSNLAVSLYKQLQFVCASIYTLLITWETGYFSAMVNHVEKVISRWKSHWRPWYPLHLASSPEHFQILSRRCGEKSGESQGTLLRHGLEMVDSVSTQCGLSLH